MDALGHDRFAVVGHDTGFAISYALAADHPERVERIALAEIPGPPDVEPARRPLFVPAPINNRLWHIPFNRVETLPEQLIEGREDVYFGYEFAIQGGALPDEVDRLLRRACCRIPTSLRGSLGFYRAFDATLAQNDERASDPLPMPVLAIGGEASYGEHVARGDGSRRRRRAGRDHRRRRPLGRRAGARRAAGRARRRSWPRTATVVGDPGSRRAGGQVVG